MPSCAQPEPLVQGNPHHPYLDSESLPLLHAVPPGTRRVSFSYAHRLVLVLFCIALLFISYRVSVAKYRPENTSSDTVSSSLGSRSRYFPTKRCQRLQKFCAKYAETLECIECQLRKDPASVSNNRPFCRVELLHEWCRAGDVLLMCIRCGLSNTDGPIPPVEYCAKYVETCYWHVHQKECYRCGFYRGTTRGRRRMING